MLFTLNGDNTTAAALSPSLCQLNYCGQWKCTPVYETYELCQECGK